MSYQVNDGIQSNLLRRFTDAGDADPKGRHVDYERIGNGYAWPSMPTPNVEFFGQRHLPRRHGTWRINDTASALDGLPSIDDRNGQRESAALRMTGTDGNPHLNPHQHQCDSTRNDAIRCDDGLGNLKVTDPMFEPEDKGGIAKKEERRGRDSNPRNIAAQRFSRPSP